MTLRILVTAVGGDIGRDVLRCLREMTPAPALVGIDVDSFAAGRECVSTFHVAPRATETKDYLAFVNKVIQDERIDVIFPVSEPEISFFNRHRNEFAGTAVLIQSPDVLRLGFDKLSAVEWLRSEGFPYPDSMPLEEYDGEFGWPIILKDRIGFGSHSVRLVQEPTELKVLSKAMKSPIIQRHIGSPSEEYTVGVFSDGNNVRQIQFRRTLGFGGLSRTAEWVRDPGLADLVSMIARRLSLKGSLNIQLRRDGAGFVPFEFNSRLSSTVFLRHAMGFRDAIWWVELATGRPSKYIPLTKPALAVRIVNEVFFDPKSGALITREELQ